MKSKAKPQMDDLVQSIGEIARAGSRLARQAEKQYAPEVEDILRTQCRDPQRIEHLLDGISFFFIATLPFISLGKELEGLNLTRQRFWNYH